MPTVRALLLAAIALLPAGGQGIDFKPNELPWAVVDQAYAQQLASLAGTRCPEADTSFAIEGTLPPGLEITATGMIQGAPRAIGTYRFGIRVSNGCGSAIRPMSLLVTGAPILVLSANAVEFLYRRGGPRPEPHVIRVTGTWPDRAYNIDGRDAAWLRAVPRLWRIPKPGAGFEADTVEISVDPGTLDPGVYETKLTFSTWQGANAPAVRVRLTIE